MVSNTNSHLKGSYELFCQVKISFILCFSPYIFTDSSRGCFRVQNSCLFSLKGRGARPRKAFTAQTQWPFSLLILGCINSYGKPTIQITSNLMCLILLWEPLWLDHCIEGLLKLYIAQHTEPGSVTS